MEENDYICNVMKRCRFEGALLQGALYTLRVLLLPGRPPTHRLYFLHL